MHAGGNVTEQQEADAAAPQAPQQPTQMDIIAQKDKAVLERLVQMVNPSTGAILTQQQGIASFLLLMKASNLQLLWYMVVTLVSSALLMTTCSEHNLHLVLMLICPTGE
jgi:hypothetical protein